MSDPLLTVKDVAHVLQSSENSVIRRFAKLDGVIDMGRATLGVRRYRVLRIPKSVVEKYLVSQQPKGNRRSVEIEVPPRADRRRKSPNWEDKAILNLAKAGLQNDCNREIFQRTHAAPACWRNSSLKTVGTKSRLGWKKNDRKFSTETWDAYPVKMG
jgi:hypothetical protein